MKGNGTGRGDLYETRVDDIDDSVDCDACFCDVGCYDNFSFAFASRGEHGHLF